MSTTALAEVLSRQLPQLRPTVFDAVTNPLDQHFERWIQALKDSTESFSAASDRLPPMVLHVAAVERRTDQERFLVSMPSRDAYCLRDSATSRQPTYWLLLAKPLLADLYFILSAVQLGPKNITAPDRDSVITKLDTAWMNQDAQRRTLDLTAIAVEFIFLHELAHAFRGHIPFLRHASTASVQMLCEIGSETSLGSPASLLQQAIEIDADLLALGIALHYASRKTSATELFEVIDPSIYAKDLGFVLGLLFRLFELWRRTAQGPQYLKQTATHPHPDVREVLCDSWLLQRVRHPEEQSSSALDGRICEQVRTGHAEGREAILALGPEFLPSTSYLLSKPKSDIESEVIALEHCLTKQLRPALEKWTTR